MSQVGNEAVILDMDGGLYFGLNEVALEIWKRLESGATIEEVQRGILAEFDSSPEVVSADIESLVLSLVDARLLAPEDDETSMAPAEA